MKNKSFAVLHNNRKAFYKLHDTNDHTTIINNESGVMLSCPHGVSQVRNGIKKVAEIGAGALTLELQSLTKANAIFKTKNNFDDANFDEDCPYKQSAIALIKKYNIKYFLDFHGLASFREMDINLGCNFGQNVKANFHAFDSLEKALVNNGFKVTIDTPFKAGLNTMANFVRENANIFALQIEVNSGITNVSKNHKKLKLLIAVLEDYINYLQKISKK